MKKRKLILIHPLGLKENDEKKFELDLLSKYFDLEIHDITKINVSKSSNFWKSYKPFKNAIIFENRKSWKKYMLNLILENKTNNKPIIIHLAMLYNYFLLDAALMCKKHNITTMRFKSYTLPMLSRIKKNIFINIFEKIIKFVYEPKFFLTVSLPSIVFSEIIKKLSIDTSILYVSGKKKYDLYKKKILINTKIVHFNSWDYSLVLRDPKYLENKKKYAVFLCDGSPGNATEFDVFNFKPPETEKIYYPLVNNFFEKLEKIFDLEIIIASHPKSYRDDELFNNRKIVKNNTENLVKNSEFLITKYSSAYSFGVLYEKPILFFYTNELYKFKKWSELADTMAEMLGTKPININNQYSDNYIKSLLKVDKDLYKKCINDYIVSVENKCNYQIIKDTIEELKI